MELTHRFTVPVSVDAAWAAFNDLEQIAPCFPGAALTSFDGERFEGLCKVKLGPISLQYTGSGRFVERDEEAKRAVIEAKGKDKRGNGTAAAAVTAQLTATGGSSTAVEVKTDLSITGRPAQFGRGVMQDVSDRLLAQFSACLEDQLGASPVTQGGETSTTATPRQALPGGGPAETPAAGQPATSAAAVEAAAPAEAGSGEVAQPQVTAGSGDAAQPQVTAGSAGAAELNLGSAVVPVLLRRYAPALVAVLVVLAVLRKLLAGRR